MATYKATSWGRTRRPKHLRDTVPESKQAATTVTVVASTDLHDDLDSTVAGENGYPTENQRFLHVLVKGGTSKSVVIYAYNYAFAEWAPLNISLGNATMSAATATTGGSGEAQMYIFDIAGVDRVAFTSGDAPTTTRAACSTF